MNQSARNLPAADTETLEMLRDSAADFCRRSLMPARLRALRGAAPAFDRAIWQEMCQLGWASISASEVVGGMGLGATAIGAICRQLGRVIAPEPMIESIAAVTLLGACTNSAASDHLHKVLSGELLLGCALAEQAEFTTGNWTPLYATASADGC